MTTTSFLRGAKCRLGACDEVGEGNQERRVVSNSRQTPDCRVMRSSLIHGDPGFNWGSGSSKGRCIRRVWGARMGPEGLKNSALKYIAPKEEKKERSPQVWRGFLMLMIVSASWSYRKNLISAAFVFFVMGKNPPRTRELFFWNCEAETTNAPPPGAYSMFEFEPTKSWSFVSNHFGDLEMRRLWPCGTARVLTLKVFENFNRMSCL